MPKKTQSAVVVPNLTGEVFDVVGTSAEENYGMTSIGGLTSPVATDWLSSPDKDEPNQLIYVGADSYIKTFTTRYTGIPSMVAKMARNISVMNGPSAPGISDPNYATSWAIIHKDDRTVFRRISDDAEFDATTLDPPNAASWNSWKSRLKGQFDSSGRAVGAYESSLTQVSVLKVSLGGATTFNGFSPIMVNSGEFLARTIFAETDNVVFYTKDTTGATTRDRRRGSIIYCRVERNAPGYASEYVVCSSPSPIIAIEHVLAFGVQHYLIVLTEAGYITFVSAPYPKPHEESVSATFSIQSILYSQDAITYNSWPTETTRADFSVQSVAYISVVVTYTGWATESAAANFSAQSVLYALVVYNYNSWPTEEARADFSANFVDYIYSPSTPTVPPAHRPTTISESIESEITATALSYA